jgi:hypothetical protein
MATVAASLVPDGISITDGLQVAMAALGALGVHQLPNGRAVDGAGCRTGGGARDGWLAPALTGGRRLGRIW